MHLAPGKREAVIVCLREGRGIRETARITGVNKTTVTNIDREIGSPPRKKGYRPAHTEVFKVSLPRLGGKVEAWLADATSMRTELEAERKVVAARLEEIDAMLTLLAKVG